MTPSVDDPAGDLDGLKAALRAATPRPDLATRAAHIALARDNFARLQGSGDGATPAARRRRAWIAAMLTAPTARGGLTAAVAVVACGLLLTPAGHGLWRRGPTLAEGGAPVAAGPAVPEPAPYAVGQAAEIAAKRPDGAAAGIPAVDPVPAPDLDMAEARSAEAAPEQPRARVAATPEAPLDEAASNGTLAPPTPVAPAATSSIASPDGEPPASVSEDALAVLPESTASTAPADGDETSYAAVRRALEAGALPPAEVVRVEEMINAFPSDKSETGEGPLHPTFSVLPTPWNPSTRLVSIVILGGQADGPLAAIAREVEARIEWNLAAVAAPRPLGPETRAPTGEDTDGGPIGLGTIGAGRSVAAIYEVTPTGPLVPGGTDTLGTLRLRWTAPDGTRREGPETPIVAGATDALAGREARFAAAVAGWGLLLSGSNRLGAWGYDEAIALAGANQGADPSGRRAEAVRLMRLSRDLAE